MRAKGARERSIEHGPGAVDPATVVGGLDDAAPSRIGPYRILETLGEGGMGVVYHAEQTKPVRRRVALKVIKLGMDTREVVARFEAERQALAVMDHPNIAHVFDAGATETGRPYFVMELVSGESITQYCDRHKLSTPQRLKLFELVCRAVQHAHQKGVIHRDLKPSNILVEVRDGQPIPKIIDFGVAKATGQQLSEHTLFTEQGQLIGTPEYMSPEQAEMSGLDIDTRTDVYSLGVILYELLTSALPFNPQTLRGAGFAEIQRIIREEDPPRPSTRLSAMAEKTGEIARARGTDARGLTKSLKGELDWIVMKCLEKDRTRRYETATSLAADVQRHLQNEPVTARPPSATYKLGKFIRRNRAGVLAGTMGVVLAAGGVAGISWQAVRATNAQRETERQAAIARAVNEFLNQDLLAAVNPVNTADRDITMREVLNAAAQRIEDKFDGQPLVEASIRETLGDTYMALGLYDEAAPHLEQAFKIRTRELGDEDIATAGSMARLASLRGSQGNYEEAENLCKDALERRRRLLGEDHAQTLASWSNLAHVYRSQGREAEAEPIYLDVLDRRRRTLGDSHTETLGSLNNLAILYMKQNRFDEAEPLYLEAMEKRRRTLDENHPDVLSSELNVAVLRKEQERYDEAERMYLLTLAKHRRVFGEDHPKTLAVVNNLGVLYKNQKLWSKAEPLYIETLEKRRAFRGPDHPSALRSLSNLMILYGEQELWDKAEPLASESVERHKRAFRTDHPRTLTAQHNLAAIWAAQGRFRESEQLFQETLAQRRHELGRNHRLTVRTLDELVGVMIQAGRAEEAREFVIELIEIRRANAIAAEATVDTINQFAWLLVTCQPEDLRDPKESLRFAQQADQMTKRGDANVLSTMARAQYQLGERESAIATLREALELVEGDAESREEMAEQLREYEAALHPAE